MTYFHRGVLSSIVLTGAVLLAAISACVLAAEPVGAAPPQLNGTGSVATGLAMSDWLTATSQSPYDLDLSFTTTNSDYGRGTFELAGLGSDPYTWATTDIPFGVDAMDSGPVSYPFDYLPVVGEGTGLEYNIPGLTQTLQLSSATSCALMTGGITNWDDPRLRADNPGVTLPDLSVVPVTENDDAGTSFTLESWCIAEQPALWAAFATAENGQPGGLDGVVVSANAPFATWPPIPGGVDLGSPYQVASTVSTTAGSIGPVVGSVSGNPALGTASILNASGGYTQPTPVDVTSALAYASETPGSPAQLDFNAGGPNVYALSNVGYLLLATNDPPAYGAAMSALVNFGLTLGQTPLPDFGIARLGQSLEQFGIGEVAEDVPGATTLTAAERVSYACGDLTPTDVQAGQTSAVCGNPPVSTPEFAAPLLLPLAAIGLFGGGAMFRRRRSLAAGT